MLQRTMSAFAMIMVLGITAPALADRDETEILVPVESEGIVDSTENHAVVLQEHA